MNIFKTNPAPSWGQILGTGLSTGLTSGLGALADNKMSQIAQRNTQKGLQASLNLTPEEAEAVSKIGDPKLQQLVVKEISSRKSTERFQANRTAAQPQIGSQGNQDQMQQQLPQEGQESINQSNIEAVEPAKKDIVGNRLIQNATKDKEAAEAEIQRLQRIPQSSIQENNSINNDIKVQQNKINAADKRILEEQKRQAKRSNTQFAKNLDLYNKEGSEASKAIDDAADAARESDRRFDRMLELDAKGDLPGPLTAAFVDTLKNGIAGFGFDLSGLLSADAQEYGKLSAEFLKQAKEYFGSRVTDYDLKALAAAIPRLSNSKEGRALIIKNLKILNQVAREKASARNTVLDNYRAGGGEYAYPPGFRRMVSEEYDKRMESKGREFSENINEITKLAPNLLEDQKNAKWPLALGSPIGVSEDIERSPDGGKTYYYVKNGEWTLSKD